MNGLHLPGLLDALARTVFLLFLVSLSYLAMFVWFLRLLENLLLSLPVAVRCPRNIRRAWYVPAQIFYRATLLLAGAAFGCFLLFETNTLLWPTQELGAIARWFGGLLGAVGAS